MDKLTRLYNMMYGSMDTLFLNRREDISHKHGSPVERSGSHFKRHSKTSSPSTSSKVSGYSSMSDLSHVTSTSREVAHLDVQSLATPPAGSIHLNENPNQNMFFAKKPKKQSFPEESSSTTTSSHGDSDSCYSDSYSLSYRTVHILSEGKYHRHQAPITRAAKMSSSSQNTLSDQQMEGNNANNRPSRLSPFISKALSQSSQSLPSIEVANKSSPHKGSFSDLLAKKKNKKSKQNSLIAKSNLEINNNIANNRSNLQQHSASTSQLPTNQVNISSVKDLVEILIYQLQVMERCQAQLQVQNQNLERANKIYQQKLEMAAKEADLAKQKADMLENEIWRCYICSRDKIQLYSADVCIVSLTCGHLFCVNCASEQRSKCPKCSSSFTIDRRIHL